MTREQEIEKAAIQYAVNVYKRMSQEEKTFSACDFVAGAEWADRHRLRIDEQQQGGGGCDDSPETPNHEKENTTMAEQNILTELQKLKDLTLLSVKTALTMDDVATLTGLKKSHIYKLVHYKRIPYYKSEGGKFTYFRKSEIEDWLLACRVPMANK